MGIPASEENLVVPDVPDSRDWLLKQGKESLKSGDLADAESCFLKALTLLDDDPDALCSLGVVYHQSQKYETSKGLIRRALLLNPLHPRSLGALGAILHGEGDSEAAMEHLNKALDLEPDNVDIMANLSLILKEKGDSAEAVKHLRRALTLDSEHSNANWILGRILWDYKDYDSAISHLQTASRKKPGSLDILDELGLYWMRLKNPASAYECYAKALEIDPENPRAHIHLAIIFLQTGNPTFGWEMYEWRLHPSLPSPLLCQPRGERWDGSPDKDLHLLLIGEQGLGDILQFMRFAPMLRTRVARITLCSDKKLVPLIEQAEIVDSVCDPEEAHKLENYQWLPLLSIPRLLDSDFNPRETSSHPYIKAEPNAAEHWRKKLTGSDSLLVGIHWQGNPAAEHGLLEGRSLALEMLAPLATVKGIRLVSLQKGEAAHGLAGCSFRTSFVECQEDVTSALSFTETAAILMQCDIVISSDTALAHLAGGLGKPTWLMLHHVPDWRWGLEEETTAWYPTMRLFRQHQPGDWPGVIQRIRTSLEQRVAAR